MIVLHVLSCLALVALVLLHAGKSGGVSDMFGGGASSSLGGATVAERNLDRLTIFAALMYGATAVVLGLILV